MMRKFDKIDILLIVLNVGLYLFVLGGMAVFTCIFIEGVTQCNTVNCILSGAGIVCLFVLAITPVVAFITDRRKKKREGR
jgi:hypothetical protein